MEENKAIVVVDDDEDMLKLLVFTLQGAAFKVQTFSTGREGVQYLVEKGGVEKIDLLVLDRVLPDMDGLDILRAIKKKYKSFCPVLFLTVLSTEKDMLQGLREGAFEYITKPFSPDLFLERVRNIIRK